MRGSIFILGMFFVFSATSSSFVSSGDVDYDASRLKRVSDQRLAELEALLALQQHQQNDALGGLDWQQIGRKKRSLDLGVRNRLRLGGSNVVVPFRAPNLGLNKILYRTQEKVPAYAPPLFNEYGAK